ncbi:uncharacterized protein METZ01_LOCUS52224 [marine metagenome]|uniref:Uncharacterized protein n=1 Tax=marine metagenome TaxID=408172 RepID=A0A381S5P6_9ZZZZ
MAMVDLGFPVFFGFRSFNRPRILLQFYKIKGD